MFYTNTWFFVFCRWLELVFFVSIMWKLFLSRMNKCTITIITIIHIKSFLERLFYGSSINSFENKRTFTKKAVLHTTTLMHCKARHVLHYLFSTNQGNGSKRAFAARSYQNQPQKIENLGMIGLIDAGISLKASVI